MLLKDKRFIVFCSLVGIVALGIWYFSQSRVPAPQNLPTGATANVANNETASNASKNSNLPINDISPVAPEPDEQVEFIEETECLAHFENVNKSADGIKQRHYERLSNYLQGFNRRARYDDLLLFGELVGFSVDETKSMLYGYEPITDDKIASVFNAYFITSKANRNKVQLGEEESEFFRELNSKSNIDSFVTALDEGLLATDKSYISQSLLGVIIKKNTNFDKAEIERLVSAGLDVDFDAIAYAIEAGKSQQTIEYLTQLYDGDLEQEWEHNEYSMNLVLAAAKEKRFELVDYFSSLGVKKQTKHSILDVVPSPATPKEAESLQQIVEFALGDGQRPYYKESENRLTTWLPEEIKEAYQYQLQVERTLPPRLSEHLDSFKAWHERITAKITSSQALETRCLHHHDMSLGEVVKSRADQEASTENLSYFEKTQYSELDEALHNELLKKQTQERERNQDQSEVSESDKDLARQINEAFTQLSKYAYAGNVDGFLQTYDEIESLIHAQNLWKREDIEKFAMTIAFSSKAYDIAIELGKQIMYFPDDTALKLYRLSDLDKLQQFVDLGVDLNYSSAGKNILTRVLESRGNSEMVGFLLNQGVSTKPSRLGLDALDLALNDLRSFRYSFYKKKVKSHIDKAKNVALIIKHKHPIERSHSARIYELRKTNPKALEVTSTILPKVKIDFKLE